MAKGGESFNQLDRKLIPLNRNKMIQEIESTSKWDFCIIGGGATGLGIAVDAASRGYKTLLLERSDFAKATSSRSTKLVHGGVRYLQQGNIKLVMEALKERGILLKNAPHLVHNQKFIVPNYKWWEKPFYGIGLKLYDWMAGRLGLGPSQFLSKEEALALVPTLDPEGLTGGILYHDGQFDDARLALSLALTAAKKNATLLNYTEVTQLIKEDDKTVGVVARDVLTGKTYWVHSKVVINATGVFTDKVMKMDDEDHENIITVSQGIHLVVDNDFLPGNTAIMIPRTDDGRVLFAVPWHGKIILGTTDTAIDKISEEPVALQEEIDFILKHISHYLTRDPQYKDIRSIFAGLRPLVKGNKKTTAALSREHLIAVSDSGLITITGGKWTTYRKMAEDVIDLAIKKNNLSQQPCITRDLKLEYVDDDNSLSEKNIRNAVQHEMCVTVEDVLSRRTRALLLDAKAAIESAPAVAAMMAKEMNKDQQWVDEQLNLFYDIAKNYLPNQY